MANGKSKKRHNLRNTPIYTLTGEDVILVAQELGIPEEEIDEALISCVQEYVDSQLGSGHAVIEDAIESTVHERPHSKQRRNKMQRQGSKEASVGLREKQS